MVKCPHCDIGMREVSARANPGTLIILDQCGKCGGIWCDKWELFPVDPAEAARIDPLDAAALKEPAALDEKPLYCPRCTAELRRFHDPSLPSEIHLRRCGRCEGIWLNRGHFGRYKNFQQKTRAEKMPAEARLRKLTEAYRDPRAWVTTGTRGMFAYPQGAAAGDDLKEAEKGAFRLILQTLLRLILGF